LTDLAVRLGIAPLSKRAGVFPVFAANLWIESRRSRDGAAAGASRTLCVDVRTLMPHAPPDIRQASASPLRLPTLPQTRYSDCFPIAATFLRATASGREAVTICRRSGRC
jgi:hypothetical protein